MEITEVKVFLVNEEKLKAFVSIVVDRCFMVNDIKVIQGKDGLFISMPSRRKKNGEFKDVAHPLNNETRRMIEAEILREYDRARQEKAGQASAPTPPQPPTPAQQPQEPQEGKESEASPEKSLEEVQEQHLRDSFWTMS